jgi:hypothetical protein
MLVDATQVRRRPLHSAMPDSFFDHSGQPANRTGHHPQAVANSLQNGNPTSFIERRRGEDDPSCQQRRQLHDYLGSRLRLKRALLATPQITPQITVAAVSFCAISLVTYMS